MNPDSRIMEQFRMDAVNWTAELVRRESQNPPGNEYEAAVFCANVLKEIGCKVIFDEFEPNRVNVIAYAGNTEDIAVVFNGHIDVVTAKGEWKYPPFSAEIENEIMYGRGTTDMKSGCASMMAAVKALYALNCFENRGLCLVLVADEEWMNKGVKRFLDTTEISADVCVVGEPTQLHVHYGNRGFVSFYVRTRGIAVHSSEPHKGKNAVYMMGKVLGILELHAQTLRGRVNEQLGEMSLSVGPIRGGVTLNTVPDFCEIEVECRIFPETNPEELRRELLGLLSCIENVEVEIRSFFPASLVPVKHHLVESAKRNCEKVLGDAVVERFPACSEASFFSVLRNIPTILLGPGNINCAHKENEHVHINEIKNAVNIYTGIAKDYL